jgi:hypothetical protein
VCPARVFTFGEKEELKDLIAKAEPLHPEYKTSPAVYYIGLPKTFLSGSIFSADSKDCLEGVKVKLTDQKTGKSLKANTNNYGDFEIDGLKAGSSFSMTIKAVGYLSMTMDDISLQKDLHLGNIYLTRNRLTTSIKS